jgi:DNA-binding response OmpR family regulator
MIRRNPAEVSILVVDDDPELRLGAARLLEKEGDTVAQATNGEEALQSILVRVPDLVLLDRDLGGNDGVKVCRRIKADPAAQNRFVVLVSDSDRTTENPSDGLEAGADGDIARTMANRELLARVSACGRLLRLTRALRQPAAELTQQAGASSQARLTSLNRLADAIAAHPRTARANEQRQAAIALRQRPEIAIAHPLAELKRWRAVMLDRADRVQELTSEVNDLARRLGEPPRYSGPAPDWMSPPLHPASAFLRPTIRIRPPSL